MSHLVPNRRAQGGQAFVELALLLSLLLVAAAFLLPFFGGAAGEAQSRFGELASALDPGASAARADSRHEAGPMTTLQTVAWLATIGSFLVALLRWFLEEARTDPSTSVAGPHRARRPPARNARLLLGSGVFWLDFSVCLWARTASGLDGGLLLILQVVGMVAPNFALCWLVVSPYGRTSDLILAAVALAAGAAFFSFLVTAAVS